MRDDHEAPGGSTQPTGEALAELREHFTDAEIVNLTWAIAAINAWNREAVRSAGSASLPSPRAQAPTEDSA